MRDGLIKNNPAAHAKAPAPPRKHVTSSDVLSAEELDRLVAALPDQWKALVYLSGWLGWRWSEAMGLRVSDVDLDAGLVHIGNVVAVESDGMILRRSGGKTDHAARTVPLPEPAWRVMAWHVATSCSGAHPSTPLFTTGNGETPYRSNFRRVFQRAVRDAGLENRKINMRQLRHTAASLMLSSGLDILDVQERLGHARGSITLDVYDRVLAGRRAQGTARMSDVMEQNSYTGFTS